MISFPSHFSGPLRPVRTGGRLFAFVLLVPLVWALGSVRARAQDTTGIFLDSQPGDVLGQGRQYSLSNVTVTHSFDSTRSFFTVRAGEWIFWFGAAVQEPLVPGAYEGASSDGQDFLGYPALPALPLMTVYDTNHTPACF